MLFRSDHLQTLFIYSSKDNLFKEDERIIAKEFQFVPHYLKYKEQKQIEEWSGLKCSEILFDSDIDNWSQGTSVFNERIIGKKQLIFLIEDEDGEKFGYYLNTQVVEKYWKLGDRRIETDNKSFEFNLESNGRLDQPMKFEIKDLYWGGYELCEKSDKWNLIVLGDIVLFKENKKNHSCCFQSEYNFDYHGIENALCGKIYYPDKFTPKRILVIQMK